MKEQTPPFEKTETDQVPARLLLHLIKGQAAMAVAFSMTAVSNYLCFESTIRSIGRLKAGVLVMMLS